MRRRREPAGVGPERLPPKDDFAGAAGREPEGMRRAGAGEAPEFPPRKIRRGNPRCQSTWRLTALVLPRWSVSSS